MQESYLEEGQDPDEKEIMEILTKNVRSDEEKT